MNGYPIVGIGGDDVHVATNEGEDFAGNGAGVLDDEVPPAGGVGDVVEEQGTASGGGAEG